MIEPCTGRKVEVEMTNQEAAKMISNDMKLHHDYLSGQYRKALNMAIDALSKEQNDCENCAIAIEDRQLVVRCKDCKYYPNGDGSTNWLPCREIITPPGWFCADGEKKSSAL